jgi:hypothetical protein
MKRVLVPLLVLGIPVALVLYLAGGVPGAAVGAVVTAAAVVPSALLRPRRRR